MLQVNPGLNVESLVLHYDVNNKDSYSRDNNVTLKNIGSDISYPTLSSNNPDVFKLVNGLRFYSSSLNLSDELIGRRVPQSPKYHICTIQFWLRLREDFVFYPLYGSGILHTAGRTTFIGEPETITYNNETLTYNNEPLTFTPPPETSIEDLTTNSISIGIRTGGRIGLTIRRFDGVLVNLSTPQTISVSANNMWNLITIVRNNNDLKIFVNKNGISSSNSLSGIDWFNIRGFATYSNNYDLNHIRLNFSAFSDEQVIQSYNNFKSMYGL